MPERIAIVGAGIIGSIAAREIVVSRPMAQVFLIDRDMVGLGASQRSTGVQFPIGKTERARSMAAFSEPRYTELGSVAPSLIFRSLDLYAVMSHEAVRAFRHTLVAASNANSTPPQRSADAFLSPRRRSDHGPVRLRSALQWPSAPFRRNPQCASAAATRR
jgi:glycine/D-amino acid oxidase-like deaminating enzyme